MRDKSCTVAVSRAVKIYSEGLRAGGVLASRPGLRRALVLDLTDPSFVHFSLGRLCNANTFNFLM